MPSSLGCSISALAGADRRSIDIAGWQHSGHHRGLSDLRKLNLAARHLCNPDRARWAGQPVWVSDTDDGTVFVVPHDSIVGITYLYGRPVFSPAVPLCGLSGSGRSGVVEYRSAGSGTGYIYLPQPSGTVVARIEIERDYSAIVFLVLVLAAIVICFDVVVTFRLRRGMTARYSDR